MILIKCKECGCNGVAHHNAQSFYEMWLQACKEIEVLKKRLDDIQILRQKGDKR